jgi:hypothetical protein
VYTAIKQHKKWRLVASGSSINHWERAYQTLGYETDIRHEGGLDRLYISGKLTAKGDL